MPVQTENKNYEKLRHAYILRQTHRRNCRVSIRFNAINFRGWSIRQVSHYTALADFNFHGYRPAVYTEQHRKRARRKKARIKKMNADSQLKRRTAGLNKKETRMNE